MKNNILLIGFLAISSFSFSQVSSAKKQPESIETKEEIPKNEKVKTEALPSSKAIPVQIKEQPQIEEKNTSPAVSGRKKL